MFNLAKGLGTLPRALNRRALFLLAPLLLLLVAACSSGSDDPIISSEQQAGGPDFSAIIVTTDMAVGHNRLMFGIIDRDGMPVTGQTAAVAAHFMVPNEDVREGIVIDVPRKCDREPEVGDRLVITDCSPHRCREDPSVDARRRIR